MPNIRGRYYTLELDIIKEFTLASCGHIFHQKCLKEYLVDGELSCPYDGCNRDIETFLSQDLLKGLQNQIAPKDKKCTREDSNESCKVSLSFTPTSSKKAKKD
ncbi:3170_t:CDS:2 [Funneliformis mosseae]|uniref:3170_t:CDS:1 n=1 Tax=Funneliformis mosseae TaxID=27381 RepID=A0A9N9B4D2_FUNMO|nr:3170_t:CDS:2 [Funneliformis mosseae]